MAGIDTQPLEVTDFSGGLTDNWFDAGPSRYQAGDNFYITVDKKLAQRPGFVPFGYVDYLMTPTAQRVDGLFTFINETILLGASNRDFYYRSDVGVPSLVASNWSRLTGPSGNPALANSGVYSAITTGEYNRQMWVTSDAASLVSRIYRDTNLGYQVRTAGLPRVYNAPLWTDSTLLSACISNANALQTSMIAHISDQANAGVNIGNFVAGPFLHSTTDKYSLGYLQAVTWASTDYEYPGPVPAVTPAPAATNQASLFTLITALINAFQHHQTSTGNGYHQLLSLLSGAPSRAVAPLTTLVSITTPTTLAQAAAVLDDLYQKWYFHQWALNLHGGRYNDTSLMSRYNITNAKIGPVSYSAAANIYLPAPPTITPNNQNFFNYVNGLIVLHNNHVGAAGLTNQNATYANASFGTVAGVVTNPTYSTTLAHNQFDQESRCTLPLVTTLDQAYVAIAWLRGLYFDHLRDGNTANASPEGVINETIKGTFTSGSTSVTGITDAVSGSAITLTVGSVISYLNSFTPVFNGPPGGGFCAVVTASGSGTATLDRSVTALGAIILTAIAVNCGVARYHAYYTSDGLLNPKPGTYLWPTTQKISGSPAALGTDLVSWNDLALEYQNCFFTHVLDNNVHFQAYGVAADITQISPTDTPKFPQWFTPTIATVSYAFTYINSYTVEPNGIQYRNESNPVYTASVQMVEPVYAGYSYPSVDDDFYSATTIYVSYPTAISAIPAITNDFTTNYDTSNIQVGIYRTTDGGNSFYSDTTITNGTTTYSDYVSGLVTIPGTTDLSLSPVIYTSGGIVGNDQPPICKCLHILDGTAYYGGIYQSGQFLPNTMVQSNAQNPDGAPATFTDTFDDAIVGISSARSTVVVLCTRSIYRIEGRFNASGQGAIAHERISDGIGCISARSIVRTEVGVFYAGSDGFYYTDGYQNIKISLELNKTYLKNTESDNQKQRICGAYDKSTRRIHWTMQSNSTDTDCDLIYTFYLDYGVKPDGVFTTLSNNSSLVPGASFSQYFRASSIVFYQRQMIKGDNQGVILKTSPWEKTDPKIDRTTAYWNSSTNVPNWATIAIPYNYTSCAVDQGTHAKRKYATRINFTGKNTGNSQMQIVANSDNGRNVGNMAPINYTFNPRWGDSRMLWGSRTPAWDYRGKMDFKRKFPATTLRANLRQVQFTNAFMGVYRYEDFPNESYASVVSATRTVTLARPSPNTTQKWPVDVVDMYIAFSTDGFVQTWKITSVTDNTLVVADPSTLLVDGTGMSWVIRGYKKASRVEISAYVLTYGELGNQNASWTSGADSGENT